MHFWPPALLMILLSAVLFLASGCVPAHKSIRTDRTNYLSNKVIENLNGKNTKLELSREKNFSVLRAEMALKGLSMDSPLLIRAFKSEMELELWGKNNYSNHYTLFRTYAICSKSGTLGPKLAEGDLQTPEGFYDVKPHRLNPNSKYFLSFDIGFPNKYDKDLGRTGSHLMIHGNCVSEGCLAMTDENIAEIYLIVEQNFKYGHSSIPIHIFPFRMSNDNMYQRRNSKWMMFWHNLKQGYDYFERNKLPATISNRKGLYLFNHDDRFAQK